MRALLILAMAAREATPVVGWKRRVAAELNSSLGSARGPAGGTLVAISLISAIATPVVVNATTMKANAEVTAATVREKAPACPRMIRVVYAGYGEGQGAPCSVLVR